MTAGLLWGLLGVGVGLLLLCFLEGLARIVLRHSPYFVFVRGTRLEMHVDLEQAPGLDPVAHFEINRDGERGPEPPADLARTYRILTSGGSAAEGYLLDEPRSWAGALREILSRPRHLRRLGVDQVHVGSVGRSRTGAQALDLIFRHTLERYQKLDAIVIMVGATDVVEWFEAGAPAHWQPDPVDPREIFGEHPLGRYRWRFKESALRELLRRLRGRFPARPAVRLGAGKSLAKVRAMRASAQEIITETPPPDEMLDRFEGFMARLLERASKHARQVLVLGQPCFDRHHSQAVLSRFWDFGVGNPYHQHVTRYFSMELAGTVMGAMNGRAKRAADLKNVRYVDLPAELEPSLELFYDFLHFTPQGAALVAARVARELLEGHAASVSLTGRSGQFPRAARQPPAG